MRLQRRYHLTPKQRGILAELIHAYPDANRSTVAAEFRRRTNHPISLKTVTDTRTRLGLPTTGLPDPTGVPPC